MDQRTGGSPTATTRWARVPARLLVAVVALAALLLTLLLIPLLDGGPSDVGGPAGGATLDPEVGIWITADELAVLPTSGRAWAAVREVAEEDWGAPDLGDGDDDHDVRVLAGALVAARTGDRAMADRVVAALEDVRGTFPDEVLPLARNLSGHVVAADLVGHRTVEFENWLRQVLGREADGRAGTDSLLESAMTDPTNHGTHARASVLAVARYLRDERLVGTVAERFRDWLGRSPEGFGWRERDWQADPARPVGINRRDAEIRGVSVDGVLPEEQRRSGGFRRDAPREGYVWEALQGVTATAAMLEQAGYPAWEWQDQAILRAFRWLHEVNDFPAEGDDTWQPWLVNEAYGTSFPAPSPSSPGKNLGFTDWTHRPSRSDG